METIRDLVKGLHYTASSFLFSENEKSAAAEFLADEAQATIAALKRKHEEDVVAHHHLTSTIIDKDVLLDAAKKDINDLKEEKSAIQAAIEDMETKRANLSSEAMGYSNELQEVLDREMSLKQEKERLELTITQLGQSESHLRKQLKRAREDLALAAIAKESPPKEIKKRRTAVEVERDFDGFYDQPPRNTRAPLPGLEDDRAWFQYTYDTGEALAKMK